jgi:hypothetical protein
MRYRLRLGPFAKEEEADAVLVQVRDIYPSALTATAGPDDLRAIASLQAKVNAQQSTAQAPAEEAPPAPPAVEPRIPVLLTEVVARKAGDAGRVSSAAPTGWPPASPVSADVLPARMPAMPATDASWRTTAPTLRHLAPIGRSAPTLETTQTVRALTPLELEDHEAMRWFVIQLSLAEQPFDPDTVPNLDIFSVYRLYAVAGLEQGRVMHALRLGFFSEEIAADAVASYLAAYYDMPTIERVSAAERERFADQRVEARKDVGATGKHAAIEITSERVVRNTVSAVKTETRSPVSGLRTVFRK